MQFLRVCGVSALSMLLASSVVAHPGHGLVEDGPIHEATSVEHGLPAFVLIVISAAIAVVTQQLLRSKRSTGRADSK